MQQLIEDLLAYARLTTRGNALTWTESGSSCDAAVKNLQGAVKQQARWYAWDRFQECLQIPAR